ncbi:hypothetical protein [Endozoicomonas atrinae]|uniref:hypothetical protein n=1 Tax=Endozoicomonas atrinae TaxID=1333660 RepID=UPI001112DE83|nr:hypothetical protein [Endozoicomonas atrinae]
MGDVPRAPSYQEQPLSLSSEVVGHDFRQQYRQTGSQFSAAGNQQSDPNQQRFTTENESYSPPPPVREEDFPQMGGSLDKLSDDRHVPEFEGRFSSQLQGPGFQDTTSEYFQQGTRTPYSPGYQQQADFPQNYGTDTPPPPPFPDNYDTSLTDIGTQQEMMDAALPMSEYDQSGQPGYQQAPARQSMDYTSGDTYDPRTHSPFDPTQTAMEYQGFAQPDRPASPGYFVPPADLPPPPPAPDIATDEPMEVQRIDIQAEKTSEQSEISELDALLKKATTRLTPEELTKRIEKLHGAYKQTTEMEAQGSAPQQEISNIRQKIRKDLDEMTGRLEQDFKAASSAESPVEKLRQTQLKLEALSSIIELSKNLKGFEYSKDQQKALRAQMMDVFVHDTKSICDSCLEKGDLWQTAQVRDDLTQTCDKLVDTLREISSKPGKYTQPVTEHTSKMRKALESELSCVPNQAEAMTQQVTSFTGGVRREAELKLARAEHQEKLATYQQKYNDANLFNKPKYMKAIMREKGEIKKCDTEIKQLTKGADKSMGQYLSTHRDFSARVDKHGGTLTAIMSDLPQQPDRKAPHPEQVLAHLSRAGADTQLPWKNTQVELKTEGITPEQNETVEEAMEKQVNSWRSRVAVDSFHHSCYQNYVQALDPEEQDACAEEIIVCMGASRDQDESWNFDTMNDASLRETLVEFEITRLKGEGAEYSDDDDWEDWEGDTQGVDGINNPSDPNIDSISNVSNSSINDITNPSIQEDQVTEFNVFVNTALTQHSQLPENTHDLIDNFVQWMGCTNDYDQQLDFQEAFPCFQQHFTAHMEGDKDAWGNMHYALEQMSQPVQ